MEHSASAYGSDFINPEDIIHHANGNIYFKNKCKLCNYKSAWDGEMAKHEKKVHNINRDEETKVVKKTPRPVPELIPIAQTLQLPSSLSILKAPEIEAGPEPIMSQKDINDICAKSANSALKDLASLFGSEDVFKSETGLMPYVPKETTVLPASVPKDFPSPPPPKIPDLIPAKKYLMDNKRKLQENSFQKKNASFFDKLKDKLMTSSGQQINLTCQHCGYESKCLTESVSHQKFCGKEKVFSQHFTSTHTSTRCQYCRQRCKSSADLFKHLQHCSEIDKSIKEDTPEISIDLETQNENPKQADQPHPMENKVFVWNNIEVPMDIELDESTDQPQYEYVDDKQDNVSLDLSIRTRSPCSESSYVSVEPIPPPPVPEKIPTHGTDISIAQHKRVFKCPHCTFWASTASRFHVHIVGHLNKKPFECSLCAYRSNWRWDITKHIKLKSVRDPAHESAKVLMTDETGRRNYTKYNKYLTEIHMSGDHSETSGGSGTRPKNYDSPSQVVTNKLELPKLSRAPSGNDFSPLLRNSILRPPPTLKTPDGNYLQKFTEKKKTSDSKKTLWKCKKCNFRFVLSFFSS